MLIRGFSKSFSLLRKIRQLRRGPLVDKPIELDRDAFTRHQTIERYRRLLTTIADRNHRKRLLELIAEEQQKQRDARDPKYLY